MFELETSHFVRILRIPISLTIYEIFSFRSCNTHSLQILYHLPGRLSLILYFPSQKLIWSLDILRIKNVQSMNNVIKSHLSLLELLLELK